MTRKVLAATVIRPLVLAALEAVDLTALVKKHLDVDELAASLDVDAIVARVDLDATPWGHHTRLTMARAAGHHPASQAPDERKSVGCER